MVNFPRQHPSPEDRPVAASLNMGTGVREKVKNHNAGLPAQLLLELPPEAAKGFLLRRGSLNETDQGFPAC